MGQRCAHFSLTHVFPSVRLNLDKGVNLSIWLNLRTEANLIEEVAYPLLFEPIFKEKVWGGRNLETVLGKKLPGNARIGESWEISDYCEDVSIVKNGILAGK